MSLTALQVDEILEDVRMKEVASQEIEETLAKFNITEKELLILLWNNIPVLLERK